MILGLSGGVDSALCAALLKEAGENVHGVFLQYRGADPGPARLAARQAGIPLTVIDITARLEEKVIAPFCASYRAGVTPSPCVLCNPAVKFAALFAAAEQLGHDKVATGHYAVVRNGALFRSDSPKDQSYMLYRLPPAWLSRLALPLGGFASKEEVRAEAARRGLTAAESADSMEVCFIPGDDHAAFLESRGFGCPPGEFVDESGRVLGRHGGIHRYTVGQRRGLGVAASGRLFVKEIDPAHDRVVLSLQDPAAGEILISDTVWQQPLPGDTFRALVKVRYSKRSDPATVTILPGGRARIAFDTPARAPAPGQSAVAYREDGMVYGGGVIEK